MNEEIKLGIEQKEALNLILKFIKSKKTAFSLSGYAGTGKSFLIKTLIDELENLGLFYVLCAPTHKAKTVLEQFTKRDGITVHKLLSLSPNINLLDLDFRNLQFLTRYTSNSFPTDTIIICDESSMINDQIYDLLIEKCIASNCKLIFVGDIAQIKPVNSIQTSKVFEVEDKYFLTEIFRQNDESALSPILKLSRTDFIPMFMTKECEYGSIFTYNQPKDFFMPSIDYFKKAIKDLNILESKILSYTNDRVNFFNYKMTEALFGLEDEYSQFQLLTGYENLSFDDYTFWNSMDYIIIQPPEKILINIPHVGVYPGFKLVLWDASDKCEQTVNILSKKITDKEIRMLTYTIEAFRLEAISLKGKNNRGASMKWKEYYRILNSFTTPIDLYFDNRLIRKKSFVGGYATTIHRSQGSSINNTFIDMKSIDFCRDKQEQRQLQYVALSRTKNNVYILQ